MKIEHSLTKQKQATLQPRYGVMYENKFAYLKANAEYRSARHIRQDDSNIKQKQYKCKGKAT